VTGRPAQFGRGVMAEVGGKLIGIFADNLAAMLAADSGAGSGSSDGSAAGSGSPAVPPAAVVPEEAQDHIEGGAAEETESAAAGQPSDAQAVPIEDLNLPVRSYNSLRREGIHTLGDLAFRTEEQLLAISNIGPASVEEIKQKLAGYHLSLAGSNVDGTPLAGGTDAPGAPPAAADVAAPAGPGTTVPAMPIPAGVNGGRTAAAPPAPAAEADLNLLRVAGPAVLKRAAPVIVGLAAAAFVALRIRARRRRR
jgi:hypothetical protein